eukprot:TRINITY_DN5372_c0_g1_i1.p2 TRINITY_DN5372_c0_g1~~TRINITY_DN5372_c0_g1_i1.p2  ORF type:complete len:100 (+),score=7.05 TRINITY_DN5372_c0_g1_i1:375-674(+)
MFEDRVVDDIERDKVSDLILSVGNHVGVDNIFSGQKQVRYLLFCMHSVYCKLLHILREQDMNLGDIFFGHQTHPQDHSRFRHLVQFLFLVHAASFWNAH